MYLKKELYGLIKTDESIFDFIQESALDGLWYWDLENTENEWMNAKFWTVLGYHPDEMPHKTTAWQNIINQDDLKVASDNFTKHCENPNHPYDQVVRYTHKNGSTVWIRCRGMAIRDKDGKPIRMLGAHQDVSDIKNREQELIEANEKAHESEAKLNALFTSMAEMVVLHELVFDENGNPVNYRITDCNDAFTKITGITRENAIGRLSTEVYGTEQPPYLKEYTRVTLTGEPRHYEIYFQPMDKHFSISVISPEKKQFATVTTDITKHKQSELLLQEKSEEIATQNEEFAAQNEEINQANVELIAAKEKAEESALQFRDLNEFLNNVISSLTHPFYVIDINDYSIKMANSASGFDLDLKKTTCHALSHNSDVPCNHTEHPCPIEIVKETLKPTIVEHIHFDEAGNRKTMEVHGYPIFDKNGEIDQIIEYSIDITARKQAEEKIREKDIQFRKLSSNLPDLIYQFTRRPDGSYHVPIASEGIKNIFGCSPEDVVEDFTPIGRVIYPEDAERVISEIEYSAEHLSYFTCEFRVQIPGKPVQWILSRSNPEKLPNGSVTWYGFNANITERKQAEEKLRNLSEMQSIILRIATEYINMPQELLHKSINNSLKELGEFVRVDRAYVFEYDWIKNVCNNTYEWCDEGINPEIDNLQNVPNEAIDYWVEAHKNGKEMSIEDVMQLPPDDGVRQILEPQGVKSVLALPMMKLDRCIGFIGFDSVRKIHKFSEQEKTLLKIFSEMLVNIGNRKELEKNLVQAKEKAEESDRLKSAFLSNMSHEIRTPMNGILGFTELLLEPDLGSEEKEDFIKIVHQSGQRMLSTVNDIVEISKIEAGLVNVSVKETDINKRLKELFRFFQPEAEKRGLKLMLEMLLPTEKKNLSTDQNKLDSILTNLIKNAIKYTNEGSIEFGCKTVQMDHGQMVHEPSVLFYIKDTGIGIPTHRQEAIFDRFIQADITDTRAFQGSGLGLAISKSYVEMLGGSIWVESREGLGS
ncbi:MAG: PAS domain S-box protein, partial [Bacteroidetes bacterium]|nr:PAS domain S-box protein [Bacteroidota bacterium]